jgi:hypothetical protein
VIDLLFFDGSPATPGPFARDTAVLFIGWALGILSSPVTDAIRRRSAKHRLSRSVATELRSLQDTLASVVIQVAKRRHVLNRSLLEALLSTLNASRQVLADGRALRMITGLLEVDERAWIAGQASDPGQGAPGILSLKVYGLPFLESHLHRLELYSHETQRLLVEIRAGVQLFNQLADEARHYHFMTFASGIDQERVNSLLASMEACYERAAETASDMVSRVATLLQSDEMRTS